MKAMLFGRSGDLIYQLAALKMHQRRSGERIDVLVLPAEDFGFPPDAAQWLLPLLESQTDYVSSVTVGASTHADVTFEEWWFGGYRARECNLAHGIVDFWAYQTGGEADHSCIKSPWLTIHAAENGKTLINRTGRYEPKGVDWKALVAGHPNLTFLGRKHEYDDFRELLEMGADQLPTVETANALESARLVQGCRRLIGVQSATLAMAHGLGKPVTVVCDPDRPDCIFRRNDADYPGISAEIIERWGI